MKKNYKNERAIISAYATVAVLTFILILGAILTGAMSVRKSQLKTMPEIKKVYEKDLEQKYAIYNAEVEKRRDKVAPQATITVSSQNVKIGEKVTVTIKQSDNKNRLDVSKCKYVYNNSSSAIGKNSNLYTSSIGSSEKNIELTFSSAGTFYVHVLTVDLDKNSAETISPAITVTQ